MANVVEGLFYSSSEEWVRSEDGIVTVGVTDHAQDQLGDIVFLELPEVGRVLEREEVFGVVESVKTLSDLVSPVAGEIVEVNQALVDAPEAVNSDPFGEAWLVKIRPSALEDDLSQLMTADAYRSHLAEQDH